MSKFSLFFKKNTNFTGKQLENLNFKKAKFLGYCFYMEPSI